MVSFECHVPDCGGFERGKPGRSCITRLPPYKSNQAKETGLTIPRAREFGSSGIHSLFGSDFFEAPVTCSVGKTGYRYGLGMLPFPHPQSVEPIRSLNGTPVAPLGHLSTIGPVPVAWASSTLLESFYTTLAARYGLAVFEAPRVLSGAHMSRGFYRITTPAQPVSTALAAVHSSLAPQFETALSCLQARRAVWSRLRPWHGDSYHKWCQTPYSNPTARANGM